MTDESLQANPSAEAGTPPTPAVALRAQYIKDMSFENPRAPQSIFNATTPPAMDVSVNLGGQRLDEQVFEIVIQVQARAVVEKATVFLIDLSYAGIIELRAMPENLVERAVFIQGASLLFPYARRVISDITRDGGFPPLQLEPIDFHAMYLQQRGQAAA